MPKTDDERRAYNAAAQRAVRARRLAKKVCPSCDGPRDRSDRKMCHACRAKERARMAEQRRLARLGRAMEQADA